MMFYICKFTIFIKINQFTYLFIIHVFTSTCDITIFIIINPLTYLVIIHVFTFTDDKTILMITKPFPSIIYWQYVIICCKYTFKIMNSWTTYIVFINIIRMIYIYIFPYLIFKCRIIRTICNGFSYFWIHRIKN